MFTTLLESITLVRWLDQANAYLSMVVTLLGVVNDFVAFPAAYRTNVFSSFV